MPPKKPIRKIFLTASARQDLEYWEETNPKIVKWMNVILASILSDPATGIGKPERLKYELSGSWSRRINHVHRIVYEMHEENIVVLQLRDHY